MFDLWNRPNYSYKCGSNLIMWMGPLALIIVVCVLLFGCVDQSRELSTGKYERVKTAAGEDLYKVQVYCPGKTMTYVAIKRYDEPSMGSRRNDVSTFKDYITGEDVHTTCPVIEYPILRKKKISIASEPEELDDLLKNDVVGMMDKAKTPLEQVPVAEPSERKTNQPAPQNSITINNYGSKQ